MLAEQRPESIEVKKVLGETYVNLGNFARAEAVFREIRGQEGYAALGDFLLGRLALTRNQAGQAGRLFEQALQERPLFRAAMEGKVRALLQQGQGKEALGFTRRLTHRHPDEAFVFQLAGRVALEADHRDLAENFLLKATSLEPRWPSPYYLLADVYLQAGRAEQAIEKFEQALQANPGDLRTAFLLGQLYQEQGRVQKAKDLYAAIVSDNPDFLPASNNLAFLIAENETDPDQLQKALELAKKAAKTADPHMLDTLGWIYHKMGKKDLALKYLRQAKEAAPDNPVILKHIDHVLGEKS